MAATGSPALAAARNIVYSSTRGPIIVRDVRAGMSIYLAAADGLGFRLIKPI